MAGKWVAKRPWKLAWHRVPGSGENLAVRPVGTLEALDWPDIHRPFRTDCWWRALPATRWLANFPCRSATQSVYLGHFAHVQLRETKLLRCLRDFLFQTIRVANPHPASGHLPPSDGGRNNFAHHTWGGGPSNGPYPRLISCIPSGCSEALGLFRDPATAHGGDTLFVSPNGIMMSWPTFILPGFRSGLAFSRLVMLMVELMRAAAAAMAVRVSPM